MQIFEEKQCTKVQVNSNKLGQVRMVDSGHAPSGPLVGWFNIMKTT